MKRHFYLIGRNPNSIKQAIACLAAGANALEPEVLRIDNDFYIIEEAARWPKLLSPKKGPRLADYLSGLQAAIESSQKTENPLRLARVLFVIKSISLFDLSKLFEIVRANFCLSCVKLGVTTRNKNQLSGLTGFVLKDEKETIGFDGGCSAVEAHNFFKELRMTYTYANGPTLPLVSSVSKDYFIEILTAIQFRDSSSAIKPNQVYARTVNNKDSMRTYLSLGVDGFTTDKIKDALSVMAEPEFIGKFVLA